MEKRSEEIYGSIISTPICGRNHISQTNLIVNPTFSIIARIVSTARGATSKETLKVKRTFVSSSSIVQGSSVRYARLVLRQTKRMKTYPFMIK